MKNIKTVSKKDDWDYVIIPAGGKFERWQVQIKGFDTIIAPVKNIVFHEDLYDAVVMGFTAAKELGCDISDVSFSKDNFVGRRDCNEDARIYAIEGCQFFKEEDGVGASSSDQ